MKIAILGTGWLGEPLYANLLKKDYVVYGSSRKVEVRNRLLNLAALQDYQRNTVDIISQVQAGPPPHRMFAISAPDLRKDDEAFFKVDTLVITLPPGGKRENAIQAYGAEIEAILLQAEQAGVKHLIYTSSTGVYGNQRGNISESSPLAPATASGEAVVAAETLISNANVPATILRLAGLYGPARHPGRWLAGKKDIPQGDAPVNLVHRSDVIQAIGRSIEIGPPSSGLEYFNICAASHPPKKEFYPSAISHYGGEAASWLPGGQEGKRIDSRKARNQLNWQPDFDDLSGY
jgi:nucleoside-diphosphate-sugar epimerase